MSLTTGTLMLLFLFQQTAASQRPATKLLSPAICGKGTFLLMLADQPAGSETFEITCKPDGGYSVSGRTEFKVPGLSSDLNTTLELDKTGLPLGSTAHGTVADQPFDQSITIKEDKALLVTNGSQRELPYPRGAAVVGGNIFYMIQFLAAMYDVKRGGAQTVQVFPNQTARIERIGSDELPRQVSSDAPAFDRYSVTLGLTGFTLWFDQQGRLAVMLVPSQKFAVARQEYASLVKPLTELLSAATPTENVDYSAPPGAPFTAEEVTVQAKGFTLGGTLLLPKSGTKPFPAAITITGSGQETRDERLPLPGLEKYRPFGQIAEALAAAGIAVLRVDDRGIGKSGGRETLKTATTEDFADDTRAQIAYLRSRPEINANRIALVGHSEGGVIAPMVASTDDRVAAIVLMAGTAKRGDDILTFQYGDAIKDDPTMTPQERDKLIAARREMLKAIAEGGDSAKAPEMLKNGWMKFFIGYDPLPTIRKVRQPILVLQGGLDHQVTPEQAPMLEKAARDAGNKDVTLRVFPNLNHLFLPAKTGQPNEYSSLSTNQLGDEVLGSLVDWLKKRLAAGR